MKRLVSWKLIFRLKTYNPKYFPNPFYSPSLADGEAMGKAFVAGLVAGINNEAGQLPTPEEAEQIWLAIHQSARAATFFYNEEDEGRNG